MKQIDENRHKFIGLKDSTIEKLNVRGIRNIILANPGGRYPIWLFYCQRQWKVYTKRFGGEPNYDYHLRECIKYREDTLPTLPPPVSHRLRNVPSNTGYFGVTLNEYEGFGIDGFLLTCRARNKNNERVFKTFFTPKKKLIPVTLKDAIKWQQETDYQPELFPNYNPRKTITCLV